MYLVGMVALEVRQAIDKINTFDIKDWRLRYGIVQLSRKQLSQSMRCTKYIGNTYIVWQHSFNAFDK